MEVPRYAFPGGYAIVYATDAGEVICPDCVDVMAEAGDDTPLHSSIYWEGPTILCEDCNKELPSEYGDPEQDP